jgi:uncharacterized PurR-regulated membrane protein YhhQ (DUF165 family)
VKRLVGGLVVAYVGLAILANWLASKYIITVPFTDYLAPAGVFCIGAVLVIRDWLQQLIGFRRSVLLVPLAGGLSYATAEAFGWTSLEKIAVASVVAFLISETVEALVFQPLRNRSLSLGVALSATAGNALDSYIFLAIAFGSQAFFWGNFIGKMEMIAIGVAITVTRRVVLPVAV